MPTFKEKKEPKMFSPEKPSQVQPKDYFKRVDLTKLYPPFADKVKALQKACLARGAEYYATSGLRSVDEQNALYQLGRTKKNVDATPEKPMGGTVTNAKGGQSMHNFKIALDWALDSDTEREGLQPDWSPEAYAIVGEEAQKLGLEWGGTWKSFKDYPHVQLPVSAHGIKLTDLQTAYANGGYPAVEALLNKYHW